MVYFLRRLLYLIPTLFVIATIVFFMIHTVPGDPVTTMLGIDADPADIEALRQEMGLNDPILIQYLRYIMNVIGGDFGKSYYYKENVLILFAERLPATLELTVVAMIIAIILALPLGIFSAIFRYSLIDACTSIISLFGVSIPIFWLGILLMYVFSLQLGWLPLTGRGGPLWVLDGLRHIFLPAISLGTVMMASTTRLTRTSMLDVLRQDYIRTARAKGLRERTVIYKHSLKNAMLPVITNIGLQMGVLLGGSFLTETIFAWPGIGRLTVQAILRRDFPIIQGVILIVAFLFILINLLIDVLYMWFDPRIKYN